MNPEFHGPGRIFEDPASRHLEPVNMRGIDVRAIVRCSTCGAPHGIVIVDGGNEVFVDL
jgi:hypothetical protein